MNIFAYAGVQSLPAGLPVCSCRGLTHGKHTSNLAQRHSASDFVVKTVAGTLHLHLNFHDLHWTCLGMLTRCDGQNHDAVTAYKVS